MLKSLKVGLFAGALATATSLAGNALAQDAAAGEKVFKKCAACHTVGEGAKNKVGPQLNNVIGRTAGGVEGYKYSKPMIEAGGGGLVWEFETLAGYLANPRKFMKGTKMSFAGLKKEDDLANVIAYLATFSEGAEPAAEEPKAEETEQKSETPSGNSSVAAAPATLAKDAEVPSHGIFHLGRVALEEEITAWDIDVRPDGAGLPKGKGTVAQGDEIFAEQCAVCHGDFGEGKDRWPVLAGGQDTLTKERPEKTVGSYWPYLSTVYDYVRRTMPFGNARSLSDDEVYALTAYILYLNDVVTDEEFELSDSNFNEVRLPNEANFIADNRTEETHYADKKEPCMKDCIAEPAKVTMRAAVLDVTPDSEEGEGGGSIE
jgi:cytochrome c2